MNEQCFTSHQHSIGYTGDGFYRSKDPTNSIKVLKEMLQNRNWPMKNRKLTSRLRHMTLKGQGHDPNMLRAQSRKQLVLATIANYYSLLCRGPSQTHCCRALTFASAVLSCSVHVKLSYVISEFHHDNRPPSSSVPVAPEVKIQWAHSRYCASGLYYRHKTSENVPVRTTLLIVVPFFNVVSTHLDWQLIDGLSLALETD